MCLNTLTSFFLSVYTHPPRRPRHELLGLQGFPGAGQPGEAEGHELRCDGPRGRGPGPEQAVGVDAEAVAPKVFLLDVEDEMQRGG